MNLGAACSTPSFRPAKKRAPKNSGSSQEERLALQQVSAGLGAAAVAALFSLQSTPARAATAAAAAAAEATGAGVTVGEVVVTAQKREENINNVGMSIQATTGATLQKLGITNTEDLQKIVPGFLSTPNYYGTNVFTIRGVGFQDTSLAGSPTVSVYLDEMPLPFSALTNGATLDLQRVEVLKGPQGTLFGQNATGGAINYIANKPTDHFEAGINAQYGRFNDADISGYVNGPLTDTLDARLALRYNSSGPWQVGYAGNQGQTIGGKDFLNGRMSFLWKPTPKFKALVTFNGWHDAGYTQMGQLFGIAELGAPAGRPCPRRSSTTRYATQRPGGRLEPVRQQIAVRPDRQSGRRHAVRHCPQPRKRGGQQRSAGIPGARLRRASGRTAD